MFPKPVAHNERMVSRVDTKQDVLTTAAPEARCLIQQGVALYHQRDYESAWSCLSRAAEHASATVECFQFLGRACFRLRKIQEAIFAFERAMQIRPALEVEFELGMVQLMMCDDAKTATGHFLQCIQKGPGDVSGYKGLASCVVLDECPESAAKKSLRDARVGYNPDLLVGSLTEALIDAGRLTEAREYSEKRCDSVLGRAQRHIYLAKIYQVLGETERAVESLDVALKIGKFHPIISHRALFQICATGQYHKAGALYQELNRHIHFRNVYGSVPYTRPEINGAQISRKTVLLRSDQMGHGDIIQFIRFAKELKRLAAKVLVVAPSNLCPLLQKCDYIDIVSNTYTGLPPHDFEEHLLLLWLALDLGESDVFHDVPYFPLTSSGPNAPSSGSSLKPKLKVGINWSGNDLFQSKRYRAIHRSIPLQALEEVCSMPGITPYSLQEGPAREELRGGPEGWGLVKAPSGDFLHMASVIASLDLVVTVDTAIAHLAGALGKPALVLLPFAAEWRWMSRRTDSPFYPSVHLFRQERPGEWSSPVAAIRQYLEKLMIQR
jgi:tetratricopeptide (TPR) repeat protein